MSEAYVVYYTDNTYEAAMHLMCVCETASDAQQLCDMHNERVKDVHAEMRPTYSWDNVQFMRSKK